MSRSNTQDGFMSAGKGGLGGMAILHAAVLPDSDGRSDQPSFGCAPLRLNTLALKLMSVGATHAVTIFVHAACSITARLTAWGLGQVYLRLSL